MTEQINLKKIFEKLKEEIRKRIEDLECESDGEAYCLDCGRFLDEDKDEDVEHEELKHRVLYIEDIYNEFPTAREVLMWVLELIEKLEKEYGK